MNRRRRMMLGGKKPLWIYKSGDTKFQNCTYSLISGCDFIDWPPFSDGKDTTVTDCVRKRYVSDSELSPSTASYFQLHVTNGFKGYKKLFVEARVSAVFGGSALQYVGINFISETRQSLTTTRALYEIDLENYQNEKTITFLEYEGYYLYIYNIWLE